MNYTTTFSVPKNKTTGPDHLAQVVAEKAGTASVEPVVPQEGVQYTAGPAPIGWGQTSSGDYLLYTEVSASRPVDAQRFDLYVVGELGARRL